MDGTFLMVVLLISRQESYFAYLFGVQEPEFYGAIVSLTIFSSNKEHKK